MRGFIQCYSILMVLCPTALTAGTDVVMVYAQLNGTVTLPMDKLEDNSKGYVDWTFDETDTKLLTRNNKFDVWTPNSDERWKGKVSGSNTDFSMTIKDLKAEDFKTFSCEVRNGFQKRVKKLQYQLLKMTVSPQSSTVIVGETLSLNCGVQRPPTGIPEPKIQWLGPQRQTGQQSNVRRIAVSQDHGEWTCEATHNGKKSSGKSTVTVVELSPGPSAPPYYYTSVSSPLNVPCSIPPHIPWELLKTKGLKGGRWSFAPLSGGVPLMLFNLSLKGDSPPTWRRCSTMLDIHPDPQKKNLSLTRKKAIEADRGNYTCALEFTNDQGPITLMRRAIVEVLKISSSPQSQDTGLTARVGQQVNLTCGLGHDVASDLQVTWKPPSSSSVKPSPQSPNAIFTIAAVSEGDGGRWRCELVWKKTMLTSADITLKIESAPVDIWLYLTIGGVTAIIILTLVLTVILMRRYRQRRMTPRHHRHQFCKCKNPKPKAFHKI